MIKATESFLNSIDALADRRREEIRNTPDTIEITGTTYYVSADGCDENDGLSPETAWKTLERVSSASFKEGDGVRFRRGDLFRGFVETAPGVTYAAYGTGEKPRFYGHDKSLADPALWELFDAEHHIWHMKEKILDSGTIFFDGGACHSRKLIPSYIGGRFVCRDDESRVFDMAEEMTEDLDLYWHFDAILSDKPSRGKDFPVPHMGSKSLGDLYLRCDRGNPGEVFSEVEAVPRRSMFQVKSNANVRIDNVCIRYVGIHSVAAGGSNVVGLHVTNCEIGFGGGTIQSYTGDDPNYPAGDRGTVTRYGNAVEIYGGCEDYVVSNCYIYQIYDAGITHQVNTTGRNLHMTGIRYVDNLVEYCVYSIEYFLIRTEGDTESYIDDCEMRGNLLRFAGYGWGQQRHNTYTPAHIKGWSFENTARRTLISDNIFDRSAYRMLHLVARKQESCPTLQGNTYIQRLGGTLGQYGGNEVQEPANLSFDECADETLCKVFGETDAKVYGI
jgi:hypothetical protein